MKNIRTQITVFVIANSLFLILLLFFANYFTAVKPLTEEYSHKGNIAAKELSNKLDRWVALKEFALEQLVHVMEDYDKVEVDLFNKILKDAQIVPNEGGMVKKPMLVLKIFSISTVRDGFLPLTMFVLLALGTKEP